MSTYTPKPCPSCGCEQFFRLGPLTLDFTIGSREYPFGKRPELETLTCVSCGRTDWYAIDPATIQQNFGGVTVAAGNTITAGA